MYLKFYLSHVLVYFTIAAHAVPLQFRRLTTLPSADHVSMEKRYEIDSISQIGSRGIPRFVVSSDSEFSADGKAIAVRDNFAGVTDSESKSASRDKYVVQNDISASDDYSDVETKKGGKTKAAGKASIGGSIAEDGKVSADGSFKVKMPDIFSGIKKFFTEGLSAGKEFLSVKRDYSKKASEGAGAADPLSALTGGLSGTGLDDILRSLPVKRDDSKEDTNGAGASAAGKAHKPNSRQSSPML